MKALMPGRVKALAPGRLTALASDRLTALARWGAFAGLALALAPWPALAQTTPLASPVPAAASSVPSGALERETLPAVEGELPSPDGTPAPALPAAGEVPTASPAPRPRPSAAAPLHAGPSRPAAAKPVAPKAIEPAFQVPYYSFNVALFPAVRTMRVEARMRLIPQRADLKRVRLRLLSRLKVERVALYDRPLRFTRDGEFLDIDLPSGLPAKRRATLVVSYAGRPLWEVNGRRLQDFDPDALVLHPEGRWYPTLASGAASATADVHVQARFWRAVGPQGVVDAEGPDRLVAFSRPGAFGLVTSRFSRELTAGFEAFVMPGAGNTAELRAGARQLADWRARGLAPKTSLRLVEVPAGFAPWALPGFQVRPRPAGGLGDWLTASVFRPGAAGSPFWSESLAVALADARGDALAALRAHATRYGEFVRSRPEAEQALTGALSPQAPGYDALVQEKGPLVWGLLREALGAAEFDKLVQKLQRQAMSGAAPLPSLLAAAGPKASFVTEWLGASGLPALSFDGARVTGDEGAYQVTGTLKLSGPMPTQPLELLLICQEGTQRVRFQTFAREMPFHFVTESRPLRLLVDPERRLPLNRRDSVLVREAAAPADGVLVYGTSGTPEETGNSWSSAKAYQERLRKERGLELPLRADKDLTPEERARSLLVFGEPAINLVTADLADQFPVRFLGAKALWWQGRSYQGARCGVVEAIANPYAPNRTVLLFAGLNGVGLAASLRHVDAAASFCVFEGPRVLESGRTLSTFPDHEAVLY